MPKNSKQSYNALLKPYARPLLAVAQRAVGEYLKSAMKRKSTWSDSMTGTKRRKTSRPGKQQVFSGKPKGRVNYKNRRRFGKGQRSKVLSRIQFTKETTGTSQSFDGAAANPAYVGHFTMPYILVTQHAFRCLLKAILAKRHYTISSFESVVPSEFVGDEYIIRGYREADFTTLLNIGAYTVTAGDNFEKVAIDWWNNWNTNRLPRDMYDHIDVDISDGGSSRYPFSNIYFDGTVKSKLKVQNRTAADDGTGDETLDRSNIASNPVFGYLYYGTGCAPRLKGQKAANIHGEGSTGVIESPLGLAGIEQAWYEPPKPSQIVRCTGYKKMALSPGDIKTSIISQELSCGFNSLHRKFDANTSATTQSFGPGKYGYFGLDKMIHESVSPLVNLIYEHDYMLSMACVIKSVYVTNPVVK